MYIYIKKRLSVLQSFNGLPISNLRTITITLELCFGTPKQKAENQGRLKSTNKHKNTPKNSSTGGKKKK